jgi:hypothetical protein
LIIRFVIHPILKVKIYPYTKKIIAYIHLFFGHETTDTDNASGLRALSYTSMIKWITNTDITHSSAFMHHLSPSPSSKVHPVNDNEFFFIKRNLKIFSFVFWNLVYYTFCTLPNTNPITFHEVNPLPVQSIKKTKP